MKSKRPLGSIADQTSEIWENGCASRQIPDLIAEEVGNIVCESPMFGGKINTPDTSPRS